MGGGRSGGVLAFAVLATLSVQEVAVRKDLCWRVVRSIAGGNLGVP
jgi:hypothetical protein